MEYCPTCKRAIPLSQSKILRGVVAVFPDGEVWGWWMAGPGVREPYQAKNVRKELLRRKAAGLPHKWMMRLHRQGDVLKNFDVIMGVRDAGNG